MILVWILGGVAIGYLIAVMHIFTRLSFGPVSLKQYRDGSRMILSMRKEI